MPSLNRVTLIGHLGNDPEMRFTAGGKPVTTFSMATSHRYQQDDQWQEETTWHNVVIWGALAERCNERLNKGQAAYVEGRLQNRSWEKDGVKHFRTDLVASQVLFLGNSRPEPPVGREHPEAELEQDDLPF